jgi:hypothetical protein
LKFGANPLLLQSVSLLVFAVPASQPRTRLFRQKPHVHSGLLIF